VEFAPGLPERPGSLQRHFLQASKDVSVCGDTYIYCSHCTDTYSAQMFYDDVLYKSMTYFLLTYAKW